jgi:hypothetical protein
MLALELKDREVIVSMNFVSVEPHKVTDCY